MRDPNCPYMICLNYKYFLLLRFKALNIANSLVRISFTNTSSFITSMGCSPKVF